MMNTIVCAVSLNPSKVYSPTLSKTISKLATKYNSYTFDPHLTVLGVLRAPQKEIEDAMGYALSGVKPLDLETQGFGYSNRLSKTLYIQFLMNNALHQIHKKLSERLNTYLINGKEYVLNPHMSLLYIHGFYSGMNKPYWSCDQAKE